MTEQILSALLANWPLFFAAALLWAFANFAKKRLPKAWLRALPLYPVIAGALWGLTPWAPLPDAVAALGSGARPLYYAGAGFLAVYWRDLWRTFQKHSVSGPSSGESA